MVSHKWLAHLCLAGALVLAAAASAPANEQIAMGSSGAVGLGSPGSYLWFRYNAGDGVGYEDSFSNVGAFVPVLARQGCDVLYIEPRMMLTNNTDFGGNVGIGYRRFLSGPQHVLGASVWYDHDEGHLRTYDQLGASFELLTNCWDFRVNSYFPLEPKFNLISETFTPFDPTYVGRNILLGTFDRLHEAALRGIDLEVGRAVPLVDNARAYGGYYYFEGTDGMEQVNGGKFRVDYQVNDWLSADFLLTADNAYGTNAVFGITVEFPGGRSGKLNDPCAASRMYQLTDRNYRITTQRRRSQEDEFAEDRFTGERIDVVHVDDDAPDGGDGSVDSPYNNLWDAQLGANAGSIIFVRSGTYNDGILLSQNQRLLGDGLASTNPHLVFAQAVPHIPTGIFALPDQTDDPIPVINPTNDLPLVLDPDGTNVWPYAVFLYPGRDGMEVAGFDITNAGGSGIVGIANGNFFIHDTIIHDAAEHGVILVNSTSDGTWTNGTALPAGTGIFDSEIRDNGVNGISITQRAFDQDIRDELGIGPPLDAQIPDDPTGDLTVQVSGNTIRDNGEIGVGIQADFAGRTIDAAITGNAQINANGPAAAMTDVSAGVALQASGGGHIVADVSDNTQINDNPVFGIVMQADGTGSRIDADVEDNSQISNNGTTAVFQASSGRLTSAGIAAFAENDGVIDLDVGRDGGTQNIADNGRVGSDTSRLDADRGDATGGVVLAAVDGGSLVADIVDNWFGGNAGAAVAAGTSGSASSSIELDINGNQITTPRTAYFDILDEEFPPSRLNVNLATGIALQPSAGRVTATVDDNLIDGTLHAASDSPNLHVGILAQPKQTGELDLDVTNNELREWDSGTSSSYLVAAVLVRTEDNSRAGIDLNGNFIHDNRHGLSLFSFDNSTARVELRDNDIYANTRNGVYGGSLDDSTFYVAIEDNRFGTQAVTPSSGSGTANVEKDVRFESDDNSTLNMNFVDNLGDAGSGFDLDEDGASTFNLYHSGNSPAPTVGAGVNVVGTPISFPAVP